MNTNSDNLLDIKNIPKLEGVRWLYADNWYDWVLSGACEYQGKKYYGICFDESHDENSSWYRRYYLVDLSKEVWQYEEERHAFFVEKVGSHFEFNIERQSRKGSDYLKPSQNWHEFYEKYPTSDRTNDYAKKFNVVGWFEC